MSKAPAKKAVLLSAGFGTRLRPITDEIPKCLVPINGVPLLEVWLSCLSKAGFTDILINTHYLADQVEDFIAQSEYKHLVTLAHEENLVGTLGTLKMNQSFWQGDNVLIAHADNLCICEWQNYFNCFINRPNGCMGTMMVFHTYTPSSCGIIELDNDQKVAAFYEKVANPPSNLANAAVYLFDENLQSEIAVLSEAASDISLDLIPHLIGKLNTWQTDGYLRDIGNIESLAQANKDIARYRY